MLWMKNLHAKTTLELQINDFHLGKKAYILCTQWLNFTTVKLNMSYFKNTLQFVTVQCYFSSIDIHMKTALIIQISVKL